MTGDKDDGYIIKNYDVHEPPEPKMPHMCVFKCTVSSPPLCHGRQKIILITTINDGNNDNNNNHLLSPNTPTSPQEPSLHSFQVLRSHCGLGDSIMVMTASLIVPLLQQPP